MDTMSKRIETKPASVSERTKQAGETNQLKRWVERYVWTNRMLETLVTGVKGRKWFSLIDKVYDKGNLERAFRKVRANRGAAGVDHVTVEIFEKRLEKELTLCHKKLKQGKYQPREILRAFIEKLGSKEKRPLGIPCVRDRVIQTGLRQVIEPIFEVGFGEHSYGFRPKRGCKDALKRVNRLVRKEGRRWILDADIRSYFETINHERLMELIAEKISDGQILELIRRFLTQPVLEVLRTWTPEDGCPQGSVISPLLANIYLDPLDQMLTQKGYEWVRYADDLVVICETEEEAQECLVEMEAWMTEMGLALHPEKTKIVDIRHPNAQFEFLGYRFQTSRRRFPVIQRFPRRKSEKKFRTSVKILTKRNNGHSMEGIIARINPILRGWYTYFKHCNKYVYPEMDGWVRMRLRSILRKRQKKKGRGRGSDHQRWPNIHFHRLGLFSMTENRRRDYNAAKGTH